MCSVGSRGAAAHPGPRCCNMRRGRMAGLPCLPLLRGALVLWQPPAARMHCIRPATLEMGAAG